VSVFRLILADSQEALDKLYSADVQRADLVILLDGEQLTVYSGSREALSQFLSRCVADDYGVP
jgi:hypothetical protein